MCLFVEKRVQVRHLLRHFLSSCIFSSLGEHYSLPLSLAHPLTEMITGAISTPVTALGSGDKAANKA